MLAVRRRRAVAGSLALGAGVTWNVGNVGAAAERLAAEYDVSLPVVGLLTTALFVTHIAVQIPAGKAADRFGARRVGLAAVLTVVGGNVVACAIDHAAAALAARAVVGIGSGAGFVAGSDYMRFARASPVLQGVYGGATMVGAGLAIAIVPQADAVFGWRAPYLTGIIVAVIAAAVLSAAPADRRPANDPGAGSPLAIADRRLLRLAALHAASFGLSVIIANWIVTLLTRHGHSPGDAGVVGALTLTSGVLTRPLGGWAIARWPRATSRIVGISLAAGALATLALALPLPLMVLGVAAGVVGLAAGVPFAAVFIGAQRLRPDAPGAAIGFVNANALLVILFATPLVGLTFSLPGEGRAGYAALAMLWAVALLAVPRTPRTEDGRVNRSEGWS